MATMNWGNPTQTRSCFQKHRLRAIFRSASFVLLVVYYFTHDIFPQFRTGVKIRGVLAPYEKDGSFLRESTTIRENNLGLYGTLQTTPSRKLSLSTPLHQHGSYTSNIKTKRQLTNDANGTVSKGAQVLAEKSVIDCSELQVSEPKWFLLWYIIGVLYMFLCLAIVCDEFFVPALEEMSDEDHLSLSMDVAGATLMAAGGSAPELFTSLFGTFRQTDIGFGTIVGSAVFNVLFVIGMCSIFAKEVLQLTWWPLFRDCTYYVFGLLVLAVFVGAVSPGRIEAWEAAILFVMYIGYVVLMYFNERLYKKITGKQLYPEENEGASGDETATAEEARSTAMNGGTLNGGEVTANGDSGNRGGAEQSREAACADRPDRRADPFDGIDSRSGRSLASHSVRSLGRPRPRLVRRRSSLRIGPDPWPWTFRAGLVKLLRDPDSWEKTAGVGIVTLVEGDVDAVFRKVDSNGDGVIDKTELRQLFEELDCHLDEEQLDGVMAELTGGNDGQINETQFIRWYIRSEERVISQVRHLFELFDADNSGTIDRSEVKHLLEKLEPRATEQDVDEALAAMSKGAESPREEITFEEFSEWYKSSMLFDKQKKEAEEEMGGLWEFVKPPRGDGCFAYVKWLIVLPILLALTITVPDTRAVHFGKFGRFRGKFCYVSFIVSILWIGVFSFFMVDWTEIIGNTIGIPPVVMGYTFLAAGTSVPDLLSSVIVARRGEGDMAVSSSVGSNIFDILIGLPLPWLLFTLWPSLPSYVTIGSEGVWISIFILLGMVVLVVLTINFSGWKLSKVVGFVMFSLYGVYLILAIWQEWPFPQCAQGGR